MVEMILTFFGVSWAAWLFIIVYTLIVGFVDYIMFRFYIQFSPKINKVVLISGLGLIFIIGNLTWLFVVGLLLSPP
jgi:hypothetical protein